MSGFFRRLLAEQPVRFTAVVATLALAGLLEGVAVAAVVPLLNMLASGDTSAAVGGGRVTEAIAGLFGLVGVPLTLGAVLIVVLVLFAVQQVSVLFQQQLAQRSIFRFEADLRDRLYAAVLRAGWPFFLRERSSELVSALTMETTRAAQAYQYLNQLLGAGIVVVIYFALALLLSWQMTLAIGVAGAVIALLLRKRAERGAVFGASVTDDNAELQREAAEDIAAAKLVKGCAVEEQAVGRFGAFTARLAQQQYRQQMNQAVLKALFETGSIATVLGGLYAAATYLRLPLADLVVLMFVFYRISPRLTTVQVLSHNVLAYLPALERVDELTERASQTRERAGGRPVQQFEREIRFEDVSFGYGEDGATLRGVDITIPRGKTVALVGESGSGKTTLIDLLMGLLDPDSGCVTVDGTPLTDVELHSWRSRIGYVAQDSSFFHMSISENMSLTAPEATSEQIREAARLAYAEEFISGMPEGYDTIIGDRGVRLSGGQRQRIALARAIARQPQLLVLDEATSALDAESEQRIQSAIDALAHHMTIVLVTHRLATVRGADLIYVLDAGRVVESGTWDELIAAGGRFASLYRLQNLSDAPLGEATL